MRIMPDNTFGMRGLWNGGGMLLLTDRQRLLCAALQPDRWAQLVGCAFSFSGSSAPATKQGRSRRRSTTATTTNIITTTTTIYRQPPLPPSRKSNWFRESYNRICTKHIVTMSYCELVNSTNLSPIYASNNFENSFFLSIFKFEYFQRIWDSNIVRNSE